MPATFLAILLFTAQASAQLILGGGTQFDLADNVQIDRADANVVARLERVNVSLADRQWDQAVETLRQAASSAAGKLVAATPQRWIPVREACQMRMAALPPEALKLYRGRIDAVAERWYADGVRARDRSLLSKVVREAFASSSGDKALMALGELSLEAGDSPRHVGAGSGLCRHRSRNREIRSRDKSLSIGPAFPIAPLIRHQ